MLKGESGRVKERPVESQDCTQVAMDVATDTGRGFVRDNFAF